MREEVLLFGKKSSLVGIMTYPPETERVNKLPVIMLLNAGLLHRVGPNRLYVKMARNLATLGFMVLRYDFSGIGDSPVRSDNLPFLERWVNELLEAMDYLQVTRGIDRFISMGLCGGAYVSFKTACFDSRIVGVALFNSQDHLHDDSNEKLSSGIRNRILALQNWRISFSSSFNAKKWLKVVTGKVDYLAIARNQLRNLFTRKKRIVSGAKKGVADMHLLAGRGVHVLHVYSEGDEGLDYFHLMLGDNIREWIACGRLKVEIIPGANHTFTLLCNQEHLLKVVRNWAHAIAQD